MVGLATTNYGTASLQSSEHLHAASESSARRSAVKWGTIGLVTFGACASLALLNSSSTPTAPSVASVDSNARIADSMRAPTSNAASDDIFCVQSSYVDGNTKMVEPITGLKWKSRSTSASTIRVDVNNQYQEIFGFGGAFTEAAALQFEKLSHEKQEEVLTLYFDKDEGNAYEFGRVPMGSCDFSPASYNFDDVANDSSMAHFDMGVTHDAKLMIPFIQRALERNPKMKMFLAPWSPPAWMKRPNPDQGVALSMLGSAHPVGLEDQYRAAWALYFSKFISAYKRHGINFWGLTPQNEPEFAAPWESCTSSASAQAEFVGRYLGPVIKRDHPEVKIMVFDHNRGSLHKWAETLFNDPEASKFVDGIAFHWYDWARFMDGVAFHERLNDTHFVDESRFMLATESCNCPDVAHGKDAWFRAQRYAHDMISDFNNWASGWVDWNLILDHKGGPNHLNNTCDAPIIIDESEQDYYIQPMYYFIQHFSKYVPPGSRRIHSDVRVKFSEPGDHQLLTQYPSGLYPCDTSSRQAIQRSNEDKLAVNGTIYCLNVRDVAYQGDQIELIPCPATNNTWEFGANGQIRFNGACLGLNHGSSDSGARLMVQPCVQNEQAAQHQRWRFEDGVMKSALSEDKCVTAGYPFAQAAAFSTPEGKTVLVVLNENSVAAEFDIDAGDRSVATSVPGGAIRTFVW